MPANVDTYIGRLPAWHRIGKVVGEYLRVDDILHDGGLDFEVEKRQLLAFNDNDGTHPIDAWGVFRTDNNEFLGTVGAGYECIQHIDGFSFLDHLIGEINGAHYETAGSLGKGETVWGLIDVDAKSGIKGTQDESNNYLLFKTGHIGNFTFEFLGTKTRVVCQNTMMIALSEGRSSFTIRHTKNYRDRIEQAKYLVETFRGRITSIDEQLEYLAKRIIGREDMINILDELFPPDSEGNRSTRSKNNIAKILELYESNDGNAIPEIRGTAYNLFNACTEYTDHFRSVKGNSPEARANTAMFGTGVDFKNRAFNIINKNAENMMPLESPVYVDMPALPA